MLLAFQLNAANAVITQQKARLEKMHFYYVIKKQKFIFNQKIFFDRRLRSF